MADRRTVRTKANIRECFLQIMLEHPGRMAQVKELCDHADINRSTFYFYYDDIYALLAELQEEFLAHVPYMLFSAGREEYRTAVQEFVTYVKENRDMFCVLYQQHSIEDRVAEEAARLMRQRDGTRDGAGADAAGRDAAQRDAAQRLITSYSCTGVYRLMYDWLTSDDAAGEQQVADLLLNLLYYTDLAHRASVGALRG